MTTTMRTTTTRSTLNPVKVVESDIPITFVSHLLPLEKANVEAMDDYLCQYNINTLSIMPQTQIDWPCFKTRILTGL